MRAVSRVAPACTTAAVAVASSVATSATRGTPSAAMSSAAEPTDVAMIPGIKRLAETKRVWLLDQFGVLHDGVTAYPGAVDAARRLHESGAKLYVISNSSRRSTNTLRKLEPMGFDPAWFSGVVTSGEVTHQMLASRGDKKELAGTSGAASDGEEDDSDDEFWASLGKKCLHFTWSTRGPIPLDGLNLETVTDPDEADFLLAHGTEAVNGAGTTDEQRAQGAVDTSLDAMRELLKRAAARNLPLIVANPDVVTVGGDAGLLPMPGTLAKWYAEMVTTDGAVRLMGKPDRIIYDRVLEMTGTGDTEDTKYSPEDVVAVGDSLEHDVAGANDAGVDSVFVCGGIHAKELGMRRVASAAEVGDGSGVAPPDKGKILEAAEEHDCEPDYAVPVFVW